MEIQRKRAAAGWTRVLDPGREDDHGEEPRHEAFESALRANPDDAEAALVYGDWLQQQGHPRGELATLRGAAAASFLDAHAETLLGRQLHLAASQTDGPRLELRWDHGFVRWARIDGHFDRGDS